jgi:hypothetical protein
MDDGALRQFLLSTADQLQVRLSRFNTGASWQRYLQLPKEALADSSSDSPDRRGGLTELLGRFRYIASEPQYERIADLPAFAAMRDALTELASRPDASPRTGNVPDEELPMPAPNRSSRSRPFLRPASGPEYSGPESRDQP